VRFVVTKNLHPPCKQRNELTAAHTNYQRKAYVFLCVKPQALPSCLT